MPGRIRPDDLSNDDYNSQYGTGRRHRSQPPSKNRIKEEDRPQRPKFAKDDSYYDPRDKYYLSGDDGPDFHPYFADRRDDPPFSQRDDSPPRHRRESRARYESPERDESPHRYDSPPRRRQASPSRDRRRAKSHIRSHSSEDRRLAALYADDEQERVSRRSGAASSNRYRSSTTAPSSSRSDYSHDRDHDHDRPSRRSTHHYPPSSSKSKSGPTKRSSTQPASSHRRGRTTSRSSSPSSPRSRRSSQAALTSAARAALEAGAMAAIKLHDDPSPWIGVKGTKIITTALGAAMVDGFIEQRKPEMKGGMMHGVAKQVATFALGNLVTKPAAKKGLGGKHVQKGMR